MKSQTVRHTILSISIFLAAASFGQAQKVIGTFSNGMAMPKLKIEFKADSTFTYISTEHPNFYRWENFAEDGRWTVSADTIILNPQLNDKPFIESSFNESLIESDTALHLTFQHIKRYFDESGAITRTDTFQVERLDYAFNEIKKKKLTRVAIHPTTRCAFAGYIPPEVITSNSTITVLRPHEKLESIFIGCYELQGTKEFQIKDPNSNHLTLTVFSNYYQDGQLRQKKLLLKNEHLLYTHQKPNGKFDKGNWSIGTVLKKEKGGI